MADKPRVVTGLNVGWFMDLHQRYLSGEITMRQYEEALKKGRERRHGK